MSRKHGKYRLASRVALWSPAEHRERKARAPKTLFLNGGSRAVGVCSSELLVDPSGSRAIGAHDIGCGYSKAKNILLMQLNCKPSAHICRFDDQSSFIVHQSRVVFSHLTRLHPPPLSQCGSPMDKVRPTRSLIRLCLTSHRNWCGPHLVWGVFHVSRRHAIFRRRATRAGQCMSISSSSYHFRS